MLTAHIFNCILQNLFFIFDDYINSIQHQSSFKDEKYSTYLLHISLWDSVNAPLNNLPLMVK